MKSRCTVCNHHLIDDINLAILSGDYTLDELSQNFGPSRSAFHRHGRHLEKKMRRTLERLENNRKQVSLLKLSAFVDHVQARVEAAAADDDTDRVYKGSHIGSRIIHQINKMDVPLELDTAYRLLSSPGPASRDSLLPAGPQIIADLHQALRDKTLAPCPPPAENEAAEAAERQATEPPDPEKDLPQLPAARESKNQRRRSAQAARQKRHLLRQKLRQEKHLFQENNLVQNFGAGRDPQGGESQSAAPPAVQETFSPANAGLPESAALTALTNSSSLIPLPCISNPALETPPSAPWQLPPDHSPVEASPPATASENKRDKSATNAKRQRRLLRKMLRNQKDIFKAKKLVQNLTATRKNEPPAAKEETLLPLATLEIRNSELETPNSELETDSALKETAKQEPGTVSPDLDPWLSPGIISCPSELGLKDPPPDYLDTGNPELETPNPELENDSALPETANQEPGTKPPPPYDETAARADELFEISHGYKRNNPPPIIPNRRRDEDFRSRSIFGDVKNVLKYM